MASKIDNWESDNESSSSQEPDMRPPPESPVLKPTKKGKYHTLGERILALTLFDIMGVSPNTLTDIEKRTGMSKSAVYKLRSKADSRGWKTGMVVETEHVDDIGRSGRPKINTATVQYVLEIVTRNSTTRGWSCARISQEVNNTPS